jgi:hypothetical protein
MPHPGAKTVLLLQALEQRGQMRQGRRRSRLPLLRFLRLPGLFQVQEDEVPAPKGDGDFDQAKVAGVEVLDALEPRGLGQAPVEAVSVSSCVEMGLVIRECKQGKAGHMSACMHVLHLLPSVVRAGDPPVGSQAPALPHQRAHALYVWRKKRKKGLG